MPEPTTTAAGVATFAGAAVSTSALTAFGVPLGLQADVLLAGFLGSLVSIILLNSVPGTTDTWPEALRTSLRRLAVAWASSITAGYLTPLTLLIANVPHMLVLSMAFLVSAGAQRVLLALMRKYWPNAAEG
ncbi:hypothetical protein DelCs14_3871 [Delftia sp. Cs1-4]|uniref:hypothetical protein n=1 Tax=Delftia sp. (strain Cs1-4) TaxID=742013 RepID=UPI00020E8082|nr:hypothetical protein [Delftia sp. Cs1-4]AEF90858.1 hypothetical protein DelCs14_3871 [Delftia sp. Cs1-4]